MAGAKVVHRNGNAQGLNFFENRDGVVSLVHHSRLGDLKLKVARRN